MESTIKIDFESGIGKPVLKIITPNELNEDSDVRDKLVHDFLHTPSVADRNSLFSTATYFDLKSPFKLTTIQPLNYFDVLDRLKWEIVLRIMTIKEASDCREFLDWIRNESNPNSEGVTKSPVRYDDYLKVVEFFEWVSKQPYIEK